MITILRKEGLDKNSEPEIEVRGLSTDEKPTAKIPNGSIFVEIDTGKLYMFDLENTLWKEV